MNQPYHHSSCEAGPGSSPESHRESTRGILHAWNWGAYEGGKGYQYSVVLRNPTAFGVDDPEKT